MKADLHIHSKHSDRPTEWFLRRIGAPESFAEPREVYRLCRDRGMSFVTITDHNCLDGALEIADLPGTFLSAELTTYFPEDQCKIHCLVFGITEAQFRDLQLARESIYDLQKYMLDHGILHSIAHPLSRINDLLTVPHVEKLILLFNRFEGINGAHDSRAAELSTAILGQLTPEIIAELASRHSLEPHGAEPWKKTFTGGSDDHSGVNAASAHTVTPDAATVQDFLDHLRDGRHEPGGTAGTSLRLAHSLYHIAYSYYRSRVLKNSSHGSPLIGELLKRLLDGAPGQTKRTGFFRKCRDRWNQARKLSSLSEAERVLAAEFAHLVDHRAATPPAEAAPAEGERGAQQCFQTACRVSHRLSYTFVQQFLNHAQEGRLVESLQSLTSLGTVVLGLAPYFTAFAAQHKDERFLQDLAGRFPSGQRLRQRSDRRAWVTDTFSDVNGVAHTIQTVCSYARDHQRPIPVLVSMDTTPQVDFALRNFTPLGQFALPEYETQKLAFPPFLDVIEYIERENFNEVIISTPGPMGLSALCAARLLGLKMTGIYHTDFPAYVQCLTQDEFLQQLTWRYMQWFYGQMDLIYVPSHAYRQHLADNGFDVARLRVLPRGVDVERFHPAKRDRRYWNRLGLNGHFKLLYVGRVSREKNLDVLLDAFQRISGQAPSADLVIVGGGPDLDAMKARYARANVVFTGVLRGEDLAQAYASADVFVFPSTSDTFGNAVLEAQASGLPAIVSNRGGPREIVSHRQSGLVVDVQRPEALSAAMLELLRNEPRRLEMGRRGREHAATCRWEQVLENF